MRRTLALFVVVASACSTSRSDSSKSAAAEGARAGAAAGSATAPAPPATRTSSIPGRVTETTFHAPSLGVDKRYFLYLPGGYDQGERRYPVIYLLHGLGGYEKNWVKNGKLAEAADQIGLQAIVVMPDGDAGFYVNWKTPVDFEACMKKGNAFAEKEPPQAYCVKTPRYEDYIVKDLVGHIDATYRTIPKAGARAISGLSMGGFGALALTMRHRDVFSSAASHSGVASLLYAGPFPYEKGKATIAQDTSLWADKGGPIGAHMSMIFGRDIANWRAHDPSVLATGLHDGEISIYLDCGSEDELMVQHGLQYLHEVLEKAEVSHSFTLAHGKHDFAFWSDRIDDSLRFHAAHFERRAPVQ